MASVIEPNAWVGLKLPSENVRFLQVAPNTYALLLSPCYSHTIGSLSLYGR